MVGFLLQFLSDFVGWMVGALPASPFQGLLLGLEGDELKWLGWLNWAVPVHDMVSLFMVWCLAALAYAAARFSVSILRAVARSIFG